MQYKNLASGRWQSFSLLEQMANIGSDVGRAINWKNKDKKISQEFFEKALELLDLTIEDPKNRKRLKELLRLREVMADYFMFDNIYSSSDDKWNNYFYHFNYAANINK